MICETRFKIVFIKLKNEKIIIYQEEVNYTIVIPAEAGIQSSLMIIKKYIEQQ